MRMKTAFLFSGQGAQYPGMMKDLYEESAAAKKVFDLADRCLGRSISDLCFYGEQVQLNLTHNTQPCLLTAELAAYEAIKEYGISPDAVAGFSLGEYGALVAAGVFSCEEALQIIQIRADAMQEAVPVGKGGMVAIMKQNEEVVSALCDEVNGYIVPVNYNCPGQIVVSGEMQAVDRIIDLAKTRKIRCMKLAVSAPFHCELMRPASEKLREAFQTVSFFSPQMDCYSNVDAKPYTAESDIANQLCIQAKSPVFWEQTIRNMYEDDVRIFVEIGPGTTLTSFCKMILKDKHDVVIYSVNSKETLGEWVNRLKG